jgi:hypothetical protein
VCIHLLYLYFDRLSGSLGRPCDLTRSYTAAYALAAEEIFGSPVGERHFGMRRACVRGLPSPVWRYDMCDHLPKAFGHTCGSETCGLSRTCDSRL